MLPHASSVLPEQDLTGWSYHSCHTNPPTPPRHTHAHLQVDVKSVWLTTRNLGQRPLGEGAQARETPHSFTLQPCL